jgi:hypothetical protein
VYTVHTDFSSRVPTCDAYDQEDDAYRRAATFAYANFETQRNFEASHKRRLRHLWKKEDYRGVVEYWGAVMADAESHFDYIYVEETTFRVRVHSGRRRWKRKAGAQDPSKEYCAGVPTLRRSALLGEESLRLYARRTGLNFDGDTEAALSDLLTDLQHFCDREGLDYERYAARARNNYCREIDGET